MTATATVRLDYFYGTDDKMCSFYRIPKAFEKNEAYRNISLEIKYLYSIMLDRVSISARNGWLDAGRVFIYFSLSEVVKCIQAGKTKALQVISDMEKLGLIQRKKQGQGKPARIFVKNIIEVDPEKPEQSTETDSAATSRSLEPTSAESRPTQTTKAASRPVRNAEPAHAASSRSDEAVEEIACPSLPARENTRTLTDADVKSESVKTEPAVSPLPRFPEYESPVSERETEPVETADADRFPAYDEKWDAPAPVSDPMRDMAFPPRMNTESALSGQNRGADQGRAFGGYCAQNDRPAEPQTSGFRTSRLPNSEPLDVQIPDPNYNNQNNKTDFSYNQSIYPDATSAYDHLGRPRKTPSERMMDMMVVRELIRDNIDYPILAKEHDQWDMERIDQYVELMVYACCSKKETIRINGEDFPQAIVQSRFEKLNREHLLYVLECMKKNTTQVRNIRAYTLSALYNAYDTIEAYYDMRVQHDMAEWDSKG